MEEQCVEIETLDRKHDLLNLYKKVRDAAGVHKPKKLDI